MVESYREFSPREWILAKMTSQNATAVLNRSIKEWAEKAGEPWTADLVSKHSELNASRYWNPEDAERFAADYLFLESMIGNSSDPVFSAI